MIRVALLCAATLLASGCMDDTLMRMGQLRVAAAAQQAERDHTYDEAWAWRDNAFRSLKAGMKLEDTLAAWGAPDDAPLSVIGETRIQTLVYRRYSSDRYRPVPAQAYYLVFTDGRLSDFHSR